MDVLQKDLSYFKLRLQEYLYCSFPEKAWDTKFIEQRSQWAAKTYEEAFRCGNSIEQCNHITNAVLFQGLEFSPFDLLFQVVLNEFDTFMADEELRPFTLEMLPVCELLFSQYDLGHDFEDSVHYNLLYTELTGTIAIWIEENGLQ